MGRNYQVRSWSILVAGAVLAVGAYAASGPHTDIAEAQSQEIFLDWADGPENCGASFTPTPDGSNWHELAPLYCANRVQTGFTDNGDNVVSAGDYIFLDGVRFRVTSSGPVVYLDCSAGLNPTIAAPLDGAISEGDLTPETTWIEIYPEFGELLGEIEVDSENGDGVLSVCDYVSLGPITCHVKRVGCDIRVVEAPNATEHPSWGAVKGLFGKLF
ncbi:MAG: hypothetical protein ACKVU1_08075 [bacterium]